MKKYALLSILIVSFLLSCSNGGESENHISSNRTNGNTITNQLADWGQAKDFATSFVNNILIDDRKNMWLASDEAAYINEAQFNETLNNMFEIFGKPIDANLKKDETGTKSNLVGTKAFRTFWFSVSTTTHKEGEVFLTVDVVISNGKMLSDKVAMVTFPTGPPEDLK